MLGFLGVCFFFFLIILKRSLSVINLIYIILRIQRIKLYLDFVGYDFILNVFRSALSFFFQKENERFFFYFVINKLFSKCILNQRIRKVDIFLYYKTYSKDTFQSNLSRRTIDLMC